MAKMGVGIIGVLVSMMVMILIGIVVVQALVSSQTQKGWSAQANTTWSTLQSNIWVAFTLLVIIPIILGAVAILGYLRFGGG
jgi:small-conductance mechanosensitive channel